MARDVEDIEVDALLESVCARYGYDFRDYARSSMKRRLEQAAASMGFNTLSELQGRVLRDETSFIMLVSHITVAVTEMFRDPPLFAALRTEVLPYLRTYPALKIWVAGCSTGEEVLSLCIALSEEGLLDRTMIYATDIDTASLEKARRGVVPRHRVAGYSASYLAAGGARSLSAYYTVDYDAALFEPHLLDKVVFAEHNLATDAVFSEVHLIMCRNVLIYFEQRLQERAVDLFAEALCPGGYLCLGGAERLARDGRRAAFEAVVSDQHIYRRKRSS